MTKRKFAHYPNIHEVFGLSGVSPNENMRAKTLGRFYSFIMLLIAIWLLLQWHFDLRNQMSLRADYIANHAIWLVFLLEVASIVLVVKNKSRYIKQNWMKVAIVLCLPMIWQMPDNDEIFKTIIPFLALLIVLPWYPNFIQSLTDNSLRTTLITAFVVVIFLGLLVSGIDPSIDGPLEGLWWAIVTITTVGYGDIVPVTWAGRLLAAVLMVMGVSILAVITANISAILVKRSLKEVKKEEREISREEMEIMKTLQHIDKRLRDIEKKMK